MRIVFMGSAELACPCLDRLMASPVDTVAGVITQPDRARGRSRKIAPCPLRAHLGNRSVPVLTPNDVNGDESIRTIRDLAPDLITVVAYGQILKPRLLNIPRLACINVHASLLPKYRGAAPIEWAIARGETLTGITMMFMSPEMDAGDIISQSAEPINPSDTAGSLGERLALLGAELLADTLEMFRVGTVSRQPQDHSKATYAPKLKKNDGKLDWTRPAVEIHNLVRGFNPRPGCFFERSDGKKTRVFQTRIESFNAGGSILSEGHQAPGTVLSTDGEGPLVATGNLAVRLLEIQPEGRKIMSGSAYLRGHSMKPGESLL